MVVYWIIQKRNLVFNMLYYQNRLKTKRGTMYDFDR